MHLPRRMVGRDVERGEVVEVVLDVRAFGDREAHLAEDRDDLVDGLADRVDAALGFRPRRQRQIQGLAFQPLVQRGVLQRALLGLDRFGQGVLEGIEALTRVFALVGRQAAQGLHQPCDLALFAKGLDPQAFQLVKRPRAGNGGQPLVLKPIQMLHHPILTRAANQIREGEVRSKPGLPFEISRWPAGYCSCSLNCSSRNRLRAPVNQVLALAVEAQFLERHLLGLAVVEIDEVHHAALASLADAVDGGGHRHDVVVVVLLPPCRRSTRRGSARRPGPSRVRRWTVRAAFRPASRH